MKSWVKQLLIVGTTVILILFFNRIIQNGKIIKVDEKTRLNSSLWYAADLLHADVTYVETDGERIITSVTFENPEATLRIAGVKHDLDISQEDVLDVLMHNKYGRHQEVDDYLSSSIKTGITYYAYQIYVQTYFNNHQEEIVEKFKNNYSDIPHLVHMLPLEILRYVIEMAG